MRGKVIHYCFFTLTSSLFYLSNAHAIDVFNTDKQVSATPAAPILSSSQCGFGPIGEPLTLKEAVERSLCNNPVTREAWIAVKIQSASVGTARGAYLPSVNANWQGLRDDSQTDVTGRSYLSSQTLATVQTESVELTWTLYDFGARRSALENATSLLNAARASQDATLQTVFMNVSKDYYTAQASGGALTTAIDVESMAEGSLKAAQQRVAKGVAPVSDELQAQTAVEQAKLNVVKARSQSLVDLGALADDMNLAPNAPVLLPEVDRGVRPDSEFVQSIDDLIRAVKRSHPAVLAAIAKVDAAASKVSQTEDSGLPKLNLVAKYSRDNQPASLGLGAPTFPATGHEWYVGIQVTFPLFEGFVRTYQVRQAKAQEEEQDVELDKTKQKVALDVWNAYQAVQESTEILRRDVALLDIASRSFDVSTHRYKEGVANILELLNAQSALANAKQQHVGAMTQWRSDRLRLAGALGHLTADDLATD